MIGQLRTRDRQAGSNLQSSRDNASWNMNSSMHPFSCCICEEMFAFANSLERHIMEMHVPRGQKTCPKCSKTFLHFTSLKRHIQSAHISSRPFACTICGKTFKRKDVLKEHIDNIHIIRKYLPCIEDNVIHDGNS